MIDFNLKPYQWKQQMKLIFENINLVTMNIINNTTMNFQFSNSYNGELLNSILCKNIWKLSINCDDTIEKEYPIFIGNVSFIKLKGENIKEAFNLLNYRFNIPESNEYNFLCIDSGEISISLICKSMEII